MILSHTASSIIFFKMCFFFYHSCWTHCFWGANYHPMCCNEKVLAKKNNASNTTLRPPSSFSDMMTPTNAASEVNSVLYNSKYYWEYEGHFFKNIFFSLLRTDWVYLRRASLWTDALHFFLWGSSSCGNECFLSSSLFVICWADLCHKKWIE